MEKISEISVKKQGLEAYGSLRKGGGAPGAHACVTRPIFFGRRSGDGLRKGYGPADGALGDRRPTIICAWFTVQKITLNKSKTQLPRQNQFNDDTDGKHDENINVSLYCFAHGFLEKIAFKIKTIATIAIAIIQSSNVERGELT